MADDLGRQIVRQLSFIKENTTDFNGILDRLIQNEVIPILEREEIIMLSPRDQMQKIIDVVLKKKKGQTFLCALEETGNHHVVEKINFNEFSNDGRKQQGNQSMVNVTTQTDCFDSKLSKENSNLLNEIQSVREDYNKIKDEHSMVVEENKQLKEENDRLKRIQKSIREETNKNRQKYAEMHRELQLHKAVAAENVNKKNDTIEHEDLKQVKEEINILNEKNNQTVQILVDQDIKRETQIDDIQKQLLQLHTIFERFTSLEVENKQLKQEVENLQQGFEDIKLKQSNSLQHQMEVLQKYEKTKGNVPLRQNIFPQPRNATIPKQQLSPRRIQSRKEFYLPKSKSDLPKRL